MVVFTTLLPAFTLYLTINNVIDLGTSPAAGHLIVANSVNGTLVSEPSYPGPAIAANLVPGYGTDFLTADSDGTHTRLGVRALLLTDDGEYIEFTATGVQQGIPAQAAILTGQSNATELRYGDFQDGWITEFRTGSTKYKPLEDSVFVGGGTLAPNDGKSFFVGVKISQLRSEPTNVTIGPFPQ